MKENVGQNKYGRTYHYDAGDYFSQMGLVYKSAEIWGVKDLRWVRSLAPKARTIVDVGMNVGMGVIEYATWAKNVYGFEPIPDVYNLAVKNVEEAKNQTEFIGGWYKEDGKLASMKIVANIGLYNNAIGDVEKTTQFRYLQGKSGMSYIDAGAERDTDQKVKTIDVVVKTLDSFDIQDVDILKIDTEGFEYHVLRGAYNTIKKWRPIVQVEFNTNIGQYGNSHESISEYFRDLDYKCTIHTGAILKNPTSLEKGPDRVFVPKEHEYFNKTIDELFS